MTDKKRQIFETILILLSLVSLGAFLRFYMITEIPCGLFPDQALNGLDGLRFTHGVFSPVYGNREGLIIYLMGLSQLIFGTGIWQIFIVSATIGTLTIATTYLAVKEIFNKKIAFFSAFLLAVSSWDIALSRNGFRANLLPLIITLIVLFLGKAIKAETPKQKKIFYSLLAAAFALGFYTYNAYPILVLAISFIILFLFLKQKNKILNFVRNNKSPITKAVIIFTVIILPIALFVIIFPGRYFARAGGISIFSKTKGAMEAGQLFIKNFWDTFIGIFTHGDFNWRHNVSGHPLLSIFLLPFFIGGLIYSFYKREKYLFLIIVFFVMIVPAALTMEGTPPHGLRIIGIIPVLFLFPAIALSWLWEIKGNKYLSFLGNFLVTAVLLAVAFEGYSNYFNNVDSAHYYGDFRCDLTNVAASLKEKKDSKVIVDGFSFETLRYLLYPEKIDQISPDDFLKNFNSNNLIDKNIFVASSFGTFNDKLIELLSKNYKKEAVYNHFGGLDYYRFYK